MATTGTKVPGLKNIPANLDKELYATLQTMKEAQEIRLGRRGDPKDRAITLRELIDSGLAEELKDNAFDPNAGTGESDFGPPGTDDGDLSIPPAPTGFEASGVFTSVNLSWDKPTFTNFSYAEIFRSKDDDAASAVSISTTSSFLATDEVGYNQTYYYWVRFVSSAGVPGPFSNSSKAVSSVDIGGVMDELSEDLSALPGYSTIIGLIDDGTLFIRSSSEPSTRADGSAIKIDDIWLDTDDDQLYVRNSSNNAWVKARDSVIKADIDSLVTALNSANGESHTTLSAAIQNERVVRIAAEATKASATDLNSLTTNVNNISANVTSVSNAVVDGTSARAAHGLSVDANGAIAGMYLIANSSGDLQNNTTDSAIIFKGDSFAIFSSDAGAQNADSGSSNAYSPFIVRTSDTTINGESVPKGVYIRDGFIENGSIVSAKIGTLDAQKITSGFLDVTNRIDANSIEATKLDVDDLSSITADFGTMTSGTINASNVTITNLFASKILGDILKVTPIDFSPNTTLTNGGGYADIGSFMQLSAPDQQTGSGVTRTHKGVIILMIVGRLTASGGGELDLRLHQVAAGDSIASASSSIIAETSQDHNFASGNVSQVVIAVDDTARSTNHFYSLRGQGDSATFVIDRVEGVVIGVPQA